MSETYRVDGIAHEITGTHGVSAFLWIHVRCGARLPPQLGPGNIGDETDPVTCLLCLGFVEPEKMEADVDDDDGDGWGSGGGGGLGG